MSNLGCVRVAWHGGICSLSPTQEEIVGLKGQLAQASHVSGQGGGGGA